MERPNASMSREEEVCRFNLSIGSSSGGHDQSKGPPIASNLERYNSVDGWVWLKSI